MASARSSQAVEVCEDCREAPNFLPERRADELSDAARHIAYGVDGGGWCCDHVDWTDADAADAYEALWEVESRRRNVLRFALDRIAEHARLDERERGFGEASRYYALAEDAIAKAGLPPSIYVDGQGQDRQEADA